MAFNFSGTCTEAVRYMLETDKLKPPSILADIAQATAAIGFTMASDMLTGSLLRTLASTKPGGAILELGTGTGMGSAWLLDGMDSASTLLTMDKDEEPVAVARRCLGHDPRITFHVMDGVAFLQLMREQRQEFDLIFADTFPGKFVALDDALRLLKLGGLYVIDDLLPQPNWPEGHQQNVNRLLAELDQRTDLRVTKMNWSTGLIVAAKI
jgi:predicted O-methyltransferase YrrM